MLLCIHSGIDKNPELAAKVGASLRSIIRWKQQYLSEGIEGLPYLKVSRVVVANQLWERKNNSK